MKSVRFRIDSHRRKLRSTPNTDAGMKSATAVTMLVVLQLALSTAGQTYQYSRGWTNGRKRSHEVELQQYPLTFSSTRPKDFEDDLLQIISQDVVFRKKIIQLILKLEQEEMRQNL